MQPVIRDLSKTYPNGTQALKDGDRELRAVSICSLTLPPGVSLVEPETSPEIRTGFERSFSAPRRLPADLFLVRTRANSA